MTPAQRDEVIGLCSLVYNTDYAYYMDLCPERVHVMGYIDTRLVSHALWLDRRLCIGAGRWFNTAYVEGVATHPDYRKHGYGSAIMRRLHEEISSYDFGALSPASEHEDWYVSLGWEYWQGSLVILQQDGNTVPTPGEVVMIYRTPRTSDIDLTAQLMAEWRPDDLW